MFLLSEILDMFMSVRFRGFTIISDYSFMTNFMFLVFQYASVY